MKKALILCFYADCEDYDLDNLYEMPVNELYNLAKKGVENGTADIYTIDEFCRDINYGEDCLTNYYVFPHYVDNIEYLGWRK